MYVIPLSMLQLFVILRVRKIIFVHVIFKMTEFLSKIVRTHFLFMCTRCVRDVYERVVSILWLPSV